jgi:hypothetical protein
MSNLPALPDGYQLEAAAPPDGAPALPPGFQMEGQSAAPTWGDSAIDAARSAPGAVLTGAIGLAGLPGDVNNAITSASGWLAKQIPGQDPAAIDAQTAATNASPLNVLPTSAGLEGKVEDVLGKPYQPTTGLGKGVDAVGQMAPGALFGTGGVLRNLVRFAVVPGAVSETAGQLADKATSLPAWAAPAIRAGTSIVASSRLPFRAGSSPERQAMVGTLNNEGVTSLTAGQQTGSRNLKQTESVLSDVPFSGQSAEDLNTRAAEQFTAAANRRAGIIGENRLTPDVANAAFDRIGGNFDRLSANNAMEGDTQLGTDLQNASRNYQAMTPPSARAPIIDDTIRDIGNAIPANGGSLPGATYQALRSRLSAAARGTNDPQLSHALSDMTEGLDDAMERSIAQNNPADSGQFATARGQYRNMLVLERAAGGAGEQAAGGLITPAALASATKAVQGKRAFVRGQGDFAGLARAGQGVMLPLPQSGTAPRENVMHNLQLAGILAGEAGAGGAAAASSGQSKEGTLAGAAAGIAVPPLLARILMSRRPFGGVQGYLASQPPPGLFSTVPGNLNAAHQIAGLFSPQPGQ